ncbi:dynein light chain type 1 [Trichinella nativa]|uniref:Dynein light chain n=2 Tax=Trichinella TaxID=6333 RepID=A0A1Y3E6A0_9BILA|nr:Dynein light chain 1, cytoplasmic [Trichinella britovi]OUC40622.1 dynein light chain type 1 [Trichinella nativa]
MTSSNKQSSTMNKAMLKPTIIESEMSSQAEAQAIQAAVEAILQGKSEKSIATHIKTVFEKKFKCEWACVVGREFIANINHSKHSYIHYYVGKYAILLWR